MTLATASSRSSPGTPARLPPLAVLGNFATSITATTLRKSLADRGLVIDEKQLYSLCAASNPGITDQRMARRDKRQKRFLSPLQ